ncbi:hypothetical protein ASC67_06315 [Methylibium sp. Root1272]|nr:hypothetical protein ASC67_06315 [Methylibium sp. Root1272]
MQQAGVDQTLNASTARGVDDSGMLADLAEGDQQEPVDSFKCGFERRCSAVIRPNLQTSSGKVSDLVKAANQRCDGVRLQANPL